MIIDLFLVYNFSDFQLSSSWVILAGVKSILVCELGQIKYSIPDHFEHGSTHGDIIGILEKCSIVIGEVLLVNFAEHVDIEGEEM